MQEHDQLMDRVHRFRACEGQNYVTRVEGLGGASAALRKDFAFEALSMEQPLARPDREIQDRIQCAGIEANYGDEAPDGFKGDYEGV